MLRSSEKWIWKAKLHRNISESIHLSAFLVKWQPATRKHFFLPLSYSGYLGEAGQVYHPTAKWSKWNRGRSKSVDTDGRSVGKEVSFKLTAENKIKNYHILCRTIVRRGLKRSTTVFPSFLIRIGKRNCIARGWSFYGDQRRRELCGRWLRTCEAGKKLHG